MLCASGKAGEGKAFLPSPCLHLAFTLLSRRISLSVYPKMYYFKTNN
jgi:hypothetical protein